jgi:hypothetical protein
MTVPKCLTVVAAAAFACCGFAAAAAAQITTGTVAGTVKDPQGAVIPGATVVLISDAWNVQVTEATTNTEGDFVFVNVPSDRYTIPVTMDGFKIFRRSDIPVGAGNRVAVGTLTVEVGVLAELAALAPGVETDGNNTPQRNGGGGSANIMDGVSAMRPRGAGVGVATADQNPRTVQAQGRVSF